MDWLACWLWQGNCWRKRRSINSMRISNSRPGTRSNRISYVWLGGYQMGTMICQKNRPHRKWLIKSIQRTTCTISTALSPKRRTHKSTALFKHSSTTFHSVLLLISFFKKVKTVLTSAISANPKYHPLVVNLSKSWSVVSCSVSSSLRQQLRI